MFCVYIAQRDEFQHVKYCLKMTYSHKIASWGIAFDIRKWQTKVIFSYCFEMVFPLGIAFLRLAFLILLNFMNFARTNKCIHVVISTHTSMHIVHCTLTLPSIQQTKSCCWQKCNQIFSLMLFRPPHAPAL